jgi:hypothetical protein
MKNVTVGPFLGINNRVPDTELADVERGRKVGDYLRNAVNVDITNSGTIRRRQGTELAQAGTSCHSLWGDDSNGYYVDGTTLYQFPRISIKTGLIPDNRVAFTKINNTVVWTDGTVLEKIVGTTSTRLGLVPPNPVPIVSAAQGGSLPAGVYQIAFTRVSATGEESGSTWPVQITVPENGAISISDVTESVYIYLSAPNGDLLFLYGPTSVDTIVPVTPDTGGVQLDTFGLVPMVGGHIVGYSENRLLVANGSTLYYSEPFSPALHNPARGYIPFPSRITIMLPCGDGVFVVADKTYYIAGADIDDSQVQELVPYGAVEGSGAYVENSENVWWFSDRGIVVGTPDGNIQNIQEGNIAVGSANFGASIYKEFDGVQQMVSSLFDSEVSQAAAGSFMEAELIRKESML